MENLLEVVMVVSMCLAVGILLYRFSVNKSAHRGLDQVVVITMGVGFLFGMAGKAMLTPVPWEAGLYLGGVWLCYTAILFSIPEKEEKNHE